MKKILIAVTCITGMAAGLLAMGDTTAAKKTLCDKGCETAYDLCLKGAEKVAAKISNEKQAELKKKAEEAVCMKGKDACLKKCAAEFQAQQTTTTTK